MHFSTFCINIYIIDASIIPHETNISSTHRRIVALEIGFKAICLNLDFCLFSTGGVVIVNYNNVKFKYNFKIINIDNEFFIFIE